MHFYLFIFETLSFEKFRSKSVTGLPLCRAGIKTSLDHNPDQTI